MMTPDSSRLPPAGTRGSSPAPLGRPSFSDRYQPCRVYRETSSPTCGPSCSALGAVVSRHLLWPLLTSGQPSRRLSTPVAPSGSYPRPPRVRRVTFPLMPVGFTSWRSVQVSGFDDSGHLTPPCRLVSASCSSGQRFAFDFLQIPPRGGHPCRSASTSPCRVCRGLSPPSHPEAPPSGTAPSRRYAPCLAHQRNDRCHGHRSPSQLVLVARA